MATRKGTWFGLKSKSKSRSKSFSSADESDHIEEKFHNIGKNMVLYKQGFKVKMKTNQWHTTYGALNINISSMSLSDEKIYKWTFKISRQMASPKMVIAICSKRDDGNTAFHHKHDRFFYGYCTKNGTKISSFDRREEYYSKPCKHHDVIAMELNISAKTLKYYKNSHDLGMAFDNIHLPQTYCLSIAVFGSDSKVELQSFRCSKFKGNKTNVVQQKEEKISVVENYSEANDRLQRENDMLCNHIDKQNAKLLKGKENVQQQQNEIDNLRLIIDKIKHDHKEMEYQHLEFQKKIQCLKLQRLDQKNYAQWSTKQVICWIVQLNYDSYKQYELSLTEMFLKESIDGSCLKDIEAQDIDLWNIEVAQHKLDILNNIKLLTQKSVDNDVYIDMNTLGPGYVQNINVEYIASLPSSVPPPPPPISDHNLLRVDSIDDISNIPSDPQVDDIVPSTSGLGLDYIEVEAKQAMSDAPVGHGYYDSLDILQHKYLSQAINERGSLTPQ